MLLLHGFPDFWYGWRHQIGPLAAAGYRVVAPDQWGYNRSDKPRPVRAYRLDVLAGDVLRLADAVAPRQLSALLGHDWGTVVARWIALHHPERLTRLGILTAPHLAVLMSAAPAALPTRRTTRGTVWSALSTGSSSVAASPPAVRSGPSPTYVGAVPYTGRTRLPTWVPETSGRARRRAS